MRDAIDILTAFETLSAERMPMALATIVAVEGSSYRRLGARMLIAADGRRLGTVSGGCLEADVARRAQGVIDAGVPALCRYETGDDPDQVLFIDEETVADPGVALGCGGSLEILIEPVSAEQPGAIVYLRKAIRERQPCRAALIYRTGGSVDAVVGTLVPFLDAMPPSCDGSTFDRDLPDGFHRLRMEKGWIDLCLESFLPPQQLLILGDGPDVLPLVEMARMQGWHSTVAGYRNNHKLPANETIELSDHAETILPIDPSTAVVLMTHDLQRDARLLRHLSTAAPAYVGVLGPLHRTRRLLEAAGIDASDFAGRLFAPVGLDLGGEGPQRVALSIIAEISAVLANASANHLRNKAGGIHESVPAAPAIVFR